VLDNGRAEREGGAIFVKLLSGYNAGIDEEIGEIIFVGEHCFLKRGFNGS
jgi:hypothetical protein